MEGGWGMVKMFDVFKPNFHKVTCSNGEVFLTFVKLVFSYNSSNTRKSVSSNFQTPRSRLEKRDAAEFFLTNFEVFGNRRKHSFECLI